MHEHFINTCILINLQQWSTLSYRQLCLGTQMSHQYQIIIRRMNKHNKANTCGGLISISEHHLSEVQSRKYQRERGDFNWWTWASRPRQDLCRELLAIKSAGAFGNAWQIDKVNGYLAVKQRKANQDSGKVIKGFQLLQLRTAVGAKTLTSAAAKRKAIFPDYTLNVS